MKSRSVAVAPLAASAAGGGTRSPAVRHLTQALRRDGRSTAAALLALLAWDASGADLAAARLFGSGRGFAWRDGFWTSTLLHGGGRIAACVMLALLVVAALRAGAGTAAQPGRAARWRWTAVTLLAVLAVPAIKRLSLTSCPWDLAEFGGVAHYVSHWTWGLGDGGAGHCFPSGHAVAAFAFLSLYFLWRDLNPRRARVWLLGVLAAGLAFGGAQLVRGAHYPSHTLWTAWLCWALCATAAAVFDARRSRSA